MNVNLLTVILCMLIVAEAFCQRFEVGTASPIIIAATIPALLFLMSQFLHLILNFEKYKR